MVGTDGVSIRRRLYTNAHAFNFLLAVVIKMRSKRHKQRRALKYMARQREY